VIDSYGSFPRVRAVRQHLAFDPQADPERFAARPDVLADGVWRERLALLRKYDLRCEIELRSPQLSGFADAARSYPDMQFILPLMGWPIDVTNAGYRAWKLDRKMLSGCTNVAVKIFGMECIFGLKWTVDQVRPWILHTIDSFGPARCMFASHMPIARLSRSFQDVYGAYFDVVSDFSGSDKQKLFHDTASTIYGV
jgi:predicted TIM-barrel fold metal-dependent hydrolase